MMSELKPVQHYLFIYDRKADKLLGLREFGTDADAALTAYAEAEIEYSGMQWMDIVLLASQSLESVRRTHGNYFDGEARRSVERALAMSF